MKKAHLILALTITLTILTLCIAVDGHPICSRRCDFSRLHPFHIDMIPEGAVLKMVKPEYPRTARKHGKRGSVTVMTLVDDRGWVLRACMTSGDSVFKTPSERAALRWRFNPNVFTSDSSKSGYYQIPIVFNFAP